MPAVLPDANVRKGAPVDQDPARGGLEKTQHDLHQGCLAASRGAHKGDGLTSSDVDTDATEHFGHGFTVPKRHVIETEGTAY